MAPPTAEDLAAIADMLPGLSFEQQMAIATAPRSSSSSNFSTSSQDPAQFAENMKLLRDQLRESSLGREQKTAIDKYLAQLQERNQRFVELKSAQDNLIKVSEQRENARQSDNNRKESARQANLRAAVDQYQTALSLIPQMGQLALEESKRVQSILQDGGDFLARAFESRGGSSPFGAVLQADQINAVSGTLARLRQQIDTALAGGPPDLNAGSYDAGTYQPPALTGGFGAQLGEMPTLDIPQAAPAPSPEVATAGGGGGFAGGGGQAAAPAAQGFGQYLTPGYTYGDPAAEGNPAAYSAYDSRGPVSGSPQVGSAPVAQGDGSTVQAVDGGFVRFMPDGEIVQPNGQTVNERVNTTLPGYRIPGGTAQDRYRNAMEGASQVVLDQITWGPKKVGGFLGSLYDMTPAAKRASGKTLSGYADGGMTREGAFIVGDHPSGMPMGTEETIINPPEKDGSPHPIGVLNNAQTQQMTGAGFSRYATGTGAYYDQSGNEVAGGFGMFGAPSAKTPEGLTYRSNNTTPVAVNNGSGQGYGFNPWAGVVTPHASIAGRPMPGNISPGSKEHLDWLKNGEPTPAPAPVAPKVTQAQLVAMARRTSPPALQALFNNSSIPAQTALKSTVPGEDVYMKTPTARQWMALTPEEQKAAQSRYNVEFNAGNGFVQNRIASLYGSTGSRQRGFVGAAGL